MVIIKALPYTLGLFLCLYIQLSSAQLPKAVTDAMAKREERYHHYLWHLIRDNWNRFDAADQAEIKRRKWQPPRPSRSYDSNGNSYALTENNSGQDFLYMHQQMIKKVRNMVKNNATATALLTGWKTIPAPGDMKYPVPKPYTITGSPSSTDYLKYIKSDQFYYDNIKPVEATLTNPTELKKMTLGQFGSRIESTIHNWLHMRFSSSESYGYRPGGYGPFPYFDKKWDDPRYDWLGDTYSSHVNPVFWKIHGWVDDRIEDWRKANGVTTIKWVGTWEGGPMSTLSDILGDGTQSNGASMRGSGPNISRGDNNAVPESTFFDDVNVNWGSSSGKAISKRTRVRTTKPKSRKQCRRTYSV